MKNYFFAVMVMCAGASSLSGRAALKQVTKQYTEEDLTGQVNAIFSNIGLSAQQKKDLLTVELENAQTLGMTTVVSVIKAYLGLATVQVSTNKRHQDSISSTPADGAAQRTLSSIGSYGLDVIQKTGDYTRRFEVAGAPTIVEHRIASYELFLERLEGDVALEKKVFEVIKAHRKINSWLTTQQLFADFVSGFISHLEMRYSSSTEGIENELSFKIFELLLHATVKTDSIISAMNSFMGTYNSYVSDELKFEPEELEIPVAEWGAQILSGGDVLKYGMLLISFAMEQIKISLRREPLLQELRESLIAQSTRIAQLLALDGKRYTPEQKQQPLFMAAECSAYVQKSIDAQGRVPAAKKEVIEECIRLVEQVSQLTNDHEIVVREFADQRSIQQMRDDMAQLPAGDVQIIKQSSSIQAEVFEQMIPPVVEADVFGDSEVGFAAEEMSDDAEPSVESLYGSAADDEYSHELGEYGDALSVPKKSLSPKVVAIMVAVGVLVVGALLEGLGKVADGKVAVHTDSSVWQFFSSIRPSHLLSKSKTA